MSPETEAMLAAEMYLSLLYARWRVGSELVSTLRGPMAVHVNGYVIVGRMLFREAA